MRLPVILGLILAAFLAFGLYTQARMHDSARDMTRLLTGVEESLRLHRQDTALQRLRRFEREWSKTEKGWALITDHHEMDQIHLAIDRADEYLTAGNAPDAQAEIASLRFLIRHIPLKESLGRSIL